MVNGKTTKQKKSWFFPWSIAMSVDLFNLASQGEGWLKNRMTDMLQKKCKGEGTDSPKLLQTFSESQGLINRPFSSDECNTNSLKTM